MLRRRAGQSLARGLILRHVQTQAAICGFGGKVSSESPVAAIGMSEGCAAHRQPGQQLQVRRAILRRPQCVAVHAGKIEDRGIIVRPGKIWQSAADGGPQPDRWALTEGGVVFAQGEKVRQAAAQGREQWRKIVGGVAPQQRLRPRFRAGIEIRRGAEGGDQSVKRCGHAVCPLDGALAKSSRWDC